MSENENVVETTNSLPSNDEDAILESNIGNYCDGEIEMSGGRFWGKIAGFNERYLFLKGDHGQKIIVKRRRIARLEVV